MSAPVLHFEIHANDRPALAAFYEAVFGWAHQSAPGMPYTLLYPNGHVPDTPDEVLSEPGIAGGMMDRHGPGPDVGAPVNGFVCIIEVQDLDAVYEAVTQNGGSIAHERQDIPGVGRVFYGRDPDNNLFGCLQP